MSQKKVISILKKNPGRYFSSKNLAELLSINVQSIYSSLKKLNKLGEIEFKTFNNTHGPPAKLYTYIIKDDFFEEALQSYNGLKAQPRFHFMPSDVLTNLMVVKELKKLVGMMKK